MNRDVQEGRGTVRQAIRAGLTQSFEQDQSQDTGGGGGYDGLNGSGYMSSNRSGSGGGGSNRGHNKGGGSGSHPGSPTHSTHPLQLPPLPQPVVPPVDNVDENESVEMLIGE